MGRGWCFLLLLCAGCSRCGRAGGDASPDGASPDATAAAPDASSPAIASGPALRPVAFGLGLGVLQRLSDGALVFTHGPVLDRLFPDGRRERLVRLDAAGAFMPIGTVGGTLDDLFVSSVDDNYPSSTDSRTWRLGADRIAKRALPKNAFYLSLMPWKDGRLLGLRAEGAAWSLSTMMPFIPSAFAVARGPSAVVPKIPAKTFVEDVIAFPSGAVFAAATRYAIAAIGREGAYALRWREGAAAVVDELSAAEGDAAQRVAGRSEDDVWIAGAGGWLAHWDGKSWTREDGDFIGVRSLSVAPDGTVWLVTGESVLMRRAPGGAWSTVELPAVHAELRAPRLKWDRISLQVDRARVVDLETQANTVVTSGDDVWVSATTGSESPRQITVLYHLGRGPSAVVDLDEEDGRQMDDALRVATPTEDCGFFVSAGPATDDALRRASAVALTVLVTVRIRGRREVGSELSSAREVADEQAMKWRSIGLPAEIYCGAPPLESLVLDPSSNDE